MNSRIIAVWAVVVVAGLFFTTVFIAAQQQKPVTDLPKPAVSSVR